MNPDLPFDSCSLGTRRSLAQLGFTLAMAAAVGGCYENDFIAPDPDFGASCAEGCGELSCLEDPRFPDGYCTDFCTETVCGEGARCSEDFGPSLCLAECSRSEDCRDAYQCYRGVCRPGCATSVDCGGDGAICAEGLCAGLECNLPRDCGPSQSCTGNRCLLLPNVSLDGGADNLENGEPCTHGKQCDSGVCAPADRSGTDPTGTCVASCTNQETCAFEEVCAPVPLDLNGTMGPDLLVSGCLQRNGGGAFLAQTCNTNEDCSSRTCVDGQCTFVCTDVANCLPGHLCTQVAFASTPGLSFSGCGYGSPDGLDTIEIGEVSLMGDQVSEPLILAVPSDVSSLMLLASQTTGTPGEMSFINVTNSQNQTLFDLNDFTRLIESPIRWYPSDREHIQMLIPNTTPDRAVALPGRYRFTAAFVEPGSQGTLRFSALVKRGSTPAGVLNLNIFLVGVRISAATAAADPDWLATLDEMRRIYSQVNVSIGDVRYFDVTGTDASRYSIIDSTQDSDSEMSELLRLSEGRTEHAINLFLVRQIGDRGGDTLGIAGDVPGPPAVHGTKDSGVIVATDPVVVGTGAVAIRNVALVMSHEIGHYLGLYHNREPRPPCPAGTAPSMENNCAIFGGTDVVQDTDRNDDRNLMWWRLGGRNGRTYNSELSSGQGLVMRHNALVGQ